MNATQLLKIVLIFIAIFHLVFGFGLMLSTSFQEWAVTSYGGTLEWNATNIYFIRIIGSFAAILGYLAFMAARNPIQYKVIVIGFVAFFTLRNISRHLFADEVYAALHISQTVNLFTSFFFGIQALFLAYLLWKIIKDSKGTK